MKMLKIVIPIVLAVVLGVMAVKLVKQRQEADNKEKTAQVYPVIVKSFIPKEENITLTFSYLAEVKNDKEVNINSKFSGKILCVRNLGDKIQKGDIVAKIDNTDLQAKLKEINTQINSLNNKLYAENINLNNLILTHKRTKKLLDVKMASIEEYQNESSKIASLKAQIKVDKNSILALKMNKKSILNNLTYTTIKSPIDGVISAKFLNKGDNAFIGKPILKISANKGNYLFITLPKVKKEIIYKNKKYKLTPLNVAVNGLLSFKAKVDDDSLVNKELVKVKIVEFEGKGVSLPYNAILSINNKNYVFTPKAKEIKIIAKGENGVVVDKLDKEVILANPDILLKIKSGYPVKVEK